uniref:Uncharacterized protein n=1 Tax=Anguilla anguilla TaxID=7936 RepID=A0A0E9Q1U9_ANGAN
MHKDFHWNAGRGSKFNFF